MEITQKNLKTAEKEKAELKLRLAEEKEEKDYLKTIKGDANFQKYVVQRIKDRIQALNTLDDINVETFDGDKIWKVIAVRKAVKGEVEDLFKDLL